MAKIVNQTIEISVCAQDSYSPVKLTQTIELAPNEQFVPAEVERWCLDHLTALALEYAQKIKKEIIPVEATQPVPVVQNVQPTQPMVQQPMQNYNNGYNQPQVQPQAQNFGGSNEIELLLNTQVPKNFFGKTYPAGYSTYGYSLRACSNKELNYLAYQCNKSKNTQVAYNAQRLLSLGYKGL